jgi:hypothetical protein
MKTEKHYKHFDATSAITKQRRKYCLVGLYCSKDSGKRIIWVLFVTTGFGVDEWATNSKDLDDYNL